MPNRPPENNQNQSNPQRTRQPQSGQGVRRNPNGNPNPNAYRNVNGTPNPNAYRDANGTQNPNAYRNANGTQNPNAYRDANGTQNPNIYRNANGTQNLNAYQNIPNPDLRRMETGNGNPQRSNPYGNPHQPTQRTNSMMNRDESRTSNRNLSSNSQQQKKRKKRRKKKKSLGSRIAACFGILLLLGVLSVAGAMVLFQVKTGESFFGCIMDGHKIAMNSTPSDFTERNASLIYAADGETVIAEISVDKESTYVTYDQISPYVVASFVAVEDRSFWTNKGVDPKGIVRVLWNFVKSGGKTAHGASTITQQLVKLTYLTNERSLSRKVKEIVVALELTKKLTDEYKKDYHLSEEEARIEAKKQIMEYYCNVCCFANAVYGIEDASMKYLGKHASDLNLSESAFLCAVPNRPEYYNPKNYEENTHKRQAKILSDIVVADQADVLLVPNMGGGFDISNTACDQAKTEAIYVVQGSTVNEQGEIVSTEKNYNFEATYAIQCAVKYLIKQKSEENDPEFPFKLRFGDFSSVEEYQDYKKQYGDVYDQMKAVLGSGGYKIYTTIDLEKQRNLQQIVDNELNGLYGQENGESYKVQGSMTVIDNGSLNPEDKGKVVAVIGGVTEPEHSGYYTLNRTYQGYQQPGSSIKPLIVYTPALDSGAYTTSSMLNNVDVTAAKDMSVADICNMGGEQIPLRSAVENSLNGCAYWLFANNHMNNNLEALRSMMFARIMPEDMNMSSCLGGLYYGVTTEEMANAYYTLYNHGNFTDTDCIRSIIDRYGTNIYQQDHEIAVYSKEATDQITDVMKGVLTNGTASNSNWYGYTGTEAAGKTGTTNDNKSAWFCGYTPYYTISVWVGCDTPVEVYGLSGNSYPLSIWKNSMLSLIQGLPDLSFGIELEEEPEEVPCTCTAKCTEGHIDENCLLCKNDYLQCKCLVEQCTCTSRCFGDTLDETCLLCLHEKEKCEGEIPECICEVLCTEPLVIPDSEKPLDETVVTDSTEQMESEHKPFCIACMIDYLNCKGLPEIVIPAPEEPTETQPEPVLPEQGTDTEQPQVPSEEQAPPEEPVPADPSTQETGIEPQAVFIEVPPQTDETP